MIKFNAGQKYCTDALSAAMFGTYAGKAGVPVQTFANRSDMAGGSTLGNISNTRVALNTVDIGLPQLAMHSPYETAGAEDTGYLIKSSGEILPVGRISPLAFSSSSVSHFLLFLLFSYFPAFKLRLSTSAWNCTERASHS